ncbi:protein C19orf12 homolog [Cyprinus carpio]|uniref:Chromosome 19 open reading frame 12 n=3 Tax=Cyprinus carpio TaxID=7962 RepID=A0A8C1KEF9_CYPCA|nr:protein C19orf12 homolog [Cyprinus carpio]
MQSRDSHKRGLGNIDFKETSLYSPEDPDIIYLQDKKPYRNAPPRTKAAISPLSFQWSMLPQMDDVINFCCEIAKNSQIEVAVKKSKRGAAAAGGGAFIGGLLGGPPGIFIGGTLGSAVGWWMTRGQFRPLHQIIMEMSPQQRKKLYSQIMENLKNLPWDNVHKLLQLVMSNPSLNKQVLDVLDSFAKKELRANVKHGKK